MTDAFPESLYHHPYSNGREPSALTDQAEAMGRKVLVADGNVDAADSLALLLRLYGHDPVTAYTGPDALARAAGGAVDAVFMAIDLPGMDGREVCRRLCDGSGPRPGLLVALTGHGTDGDRRASRDAGFDHHLLKPADPDALLRLLAQPEK